MYYSNRIINVHVSIKRTSVATLKIAPKHKETNYWATNEGVRILTNYGQPAGLHGWHEAIRIISILFRRKIFHACRCQFVKLLNGRVRNKNCGEMTKRKVEEKKLTWNRPRPLLKPPPFLAAEAMTKSGPCSQRAAYISAQEFRYRKIHIKPFPH